VLFHAHTPWFGGGFVGVDVFFVISGFLISSLIREEIARGEFTFRGFYERRARRILPALGVTVVLAWIAAIFLYMPPEFQAFSASLIGSASFVSNFIFWRETAYFAGPAEIKPLLHLWSLAVEEQFYVLFPPMLILLGRFGRKYVFYGVLSVLIISFAISVWASYAAPGAAFYLTPSRAWELMLGTVLAFEQIPRLRSQRIAECVAFVGIAMTLAPIFYFSPGTRFPGFNAALPCIGAALLLWSGTQDETTVHRLLSSKPFVFVGLISYSLYLFHWPLLAFARYYWIAPLPVGATVTALCCAAVFATLSWKFIEQPVRSSRRLSQSRLFTYAASASMIVIVIGIVGFTTDGFAARYPDYVHLEYKDRLPEYNEGSCFLMWGEASTNWEGDKCFLVRRGQPVALLWGDSFSAHLAPGIKANADRLKYDILQYSVASCAPIVDEESTWRGGCLDAATTAMRMIAKYHVATVFLSVNWYVEAPYYHDIFAGVRRTIEQLREQGVTVVIIGQTPVFQFWDSLDVAYRLRASGRSTTDFSPYLAFDPNWPSRVDREFSGVNLIEAMNDLCRPGACTVLADGQPLYIDGGHLSVLGSKILIDKIVAALNATQARTSANLR
jgi:peptidoglycan/LPS O-acetylase OafA/YrhL